MERLTACDNGYKEHFDYIINTFMENDDAETYPMKYIIHLVYQLEI